MRDTPPSVGFEQSHTITSSSAGVFWLRCSLFIVKGPHLQGRCLLAFGGVASQQPANMFVKRLIIRVAPGPTAVPAAAKGQKASLAAGVQRFRLTRQNKGLFLYQLFSIDPRFAS